MAKIKLQQGNTVANVFAEFISAKRAKGLVNKTIHSYVNHFQAVSRHLNVEQDIVNLCKSDLDKMIASMRDAGLSPNSINSYTKMLKSFLSWCNQEGITSLNIPIYRGEETVKDTYTDKELEVLLQKPDIRKCSFGEYRDWVIINFLLNSGSRAATVRAIQIRDVDLENGLIHYRHNKNHRAQVVPLCGAMIRILREYLRFRGGEETDSLFCDITGGPLTENGLRKAIVRYRIDRMKTVWVEEDQPREGKKEFEKIDSRTYTQKLFGMMGGEEKHVTLRFTIDLLDTVVDRLGASVASYQPDGDRHFKVSADVAVSDQFYAWVCGFRKRVAIIDPPEVVEGFQQFLLDIQGRYKKQETEI